MFDKSRKTITEHISNLFKENELDSESVCRNFQHTASDNKQYWVKYYNLDVIISVGYRVKSKRGIQFRQWATKRLKEYLVKGYSLNAERLTQLQRVVNIIHQTNEIAELVNDEAKGLVNILTNYTTSFLLLNQYDSNNLREDELNSKVIYKIEYREATAAILELKDKLIIKKEASELFGNEKDQSFQGILGNILQSFDGNYLYSSIEEQAANLLYLVIKNHPFSDGNKRIGAFLFVWFLEKNKHHLKTNGQLKINDNGLVALALLVAISASDDKELLIKLIINLINTK